MSIYSNSVKRPVTTILLFVAVMVIGLYSLTRLPVDLYPEIELPFVTVMTTYPGASASDIESNVTRPIEDVLNSVSNLKDLTSTSSDGLSVIFLNFEYGSNLDEAINDIRSNLNFVSRILPEEAEDPTIIKFNSSMMPIIFYAVTANESYAGLEKILDEKIVNPLNRIEGIGNVSLTGVPGRRIYIDIDPRKLEAYNLTIEQIGGVLRSENLNMPAGFLEMGQTDYPLRIQGEFPESDVLKNIVVSNFNGNNIYLKDLAEVRDTIRESKLDTKINGAKGMGLFVQKQSGGNTVKVTKEVELALEELKKDLPPDVKIELLFSSASFIKDSISNLTETLMYAGIFVVLVVLFFLGRWRATFIVILTIPVSLIVAFIYLFISDASINIISLVSLSIAIGMVVDDAIVVLENITRHIERGSRPREAAIYATNEVWLAVIVTTLTVVAVFFPLTFVEGLTGVLFKQLGLSVTVTIITSTIAALTLTPTLSSLMLKYRPIRRDAPFFTYDGSIRKLLDRFDNFYERTLRWALRHKTMVSIIATVIFVLSMSLFSAIDTEFFPQADESTVYATVELQTGSRVENTINTANTLDSLIKTNYPEVEIISTNSGYDDQGGWESMFSAGGTHTIQYTISLVPIEEREKSAWDIADEMREDFAKFPQITSFQVTTTQNMGSFGGNAVDVEIYGYDIAATNVVANELAEKIKNIEGTKDVTISRDKSKPELQIIFDQEKMSANGLNTAMVATAVKNRVDGMIATRLRQSGDEYDVVVRFKKSSRSTLTDIENFAITNMQGHSVRLVEIAQIRENWAPPSIERKRKERVVRVSFTPFERSLTDIQVDVQKAINETPKPAGIMVLISGAIKEQMEAFMDLALLLAVSLILVYLVMASQFESLKMPFIIMFSIPFAFSGVAFALFITNTTLSVISGIGAVLLIGIVVKNAIVLVDFINLMRDRGNELYDAIALSGRSRLRPVFMTSATTILGMMPLSLSSGSGSELWKPMGIAVIGGLVFSTLVTLVIVPVVYAIFVKRGERKKSLVAYTDMDFMNGNGSVSS
ncbi:MAG: multidrug transporter AcrB [Bacteroidetes bacterium GWE2_41_25]|nr:MAG: multidrug transporter AcrB [Bacteroidetes bacterium GWA2_40_15]OFX97226.1 MAG: multidrug transporter AcrB [Bacteroidetes bacterium GWC2_40_22]OFY03726.1 MAG: multidrug transporter AcrB [Bacteroidetes bacterium GWE2_41_25]HAM08778.1 multidrug transporter AcrB [Bacteroidales bacterium]HBH83345.1 multidrug transporter AcrB [Bacteroidales bacterium]